MIFEGKYLNGLKNGKCKEYSNEEGIVKFEGDYLNGKGKEYYHDDNLSFERDYLNGKRNGKKKNMIQVVLYYLK